MSEAGRATAMQRLLGVLAAVWVGSQLTIGYAVAPVLFTTLEAGAAGQVASRLFRIEAWIGVLAGALLSGFAYRFARRGEMPYRAPASLAAAMLVCALGLLAMQPFMEALRVQALLQGTDVGHSAYAARFGVLHSVSTAIYVVESVLGLLLLWRLPRGGA
jgi:hypothetical protein